MDVLESDLSEKTDHQGCLVEPLVTIYQKQENSTPGESGFTRFFSQPTRIKRFSIDRNAWTFKERPQDENKFAGPF